MKRQMMAACIAAIGIVALSPASAGATRSATRVTIRIAVAGNAFTGKVTSPRQRCVDGRKVKLKRRKGGHRTFHLVGTDTASSRGSWRVRTQPIDRAEYRAVIKETRGCFGTATEPTKARRAGLSIAKTSSSFHGQVGTVSPCLRDRRVELQRKGPSSTDFKTIGTDLTDKRGNWQVDKAPRQGSSYRARARAHQVGSQNSCMARTSPTITG